VQSVEIQPGQMAQVTRALRSGKLIAIDDDVQGIANDLFAIDPGLRLEYEPFEDVWVVKYVGLNEIGEHEERLVASYAECDQRIVRRMREIAQPGYDFAGELDRLDREAEARHEHEMSEKIGPAAEKLAWALGRDLGRHEIPNTRVSRAVIPADIPKG
jgi:hypothetical protein